MLCTPGVSLLAAWGRGALEAAELASTLSKVQKGTINDETLRRSGISTYLPLASSNCVAPSDGSRQVPHSLGRCSTATVFW